MRHTAACIFSHVDPDVVTNFGFLPQDMLGKSIFDFYHPEDMPFLKEVYESGKVPLYKHAYLRVYFNLLNSYEDVSDSRFSIQK